MNNYFFKFIFVISVYFLLINQSFAGIVISSLMPNTDDDTNLEYIQLYNSGINGESLSGYILSDLSGKEFEFDSSYFLESNEYKKFYRSETKLLLNNTNEEIFLYDFSGNLIDNFAYENSEKNIALISYSEEELDGNIEEIPGEIDIEIISSSTSQENHSGSIEEGIGEIFDSNGNLDEDGIGEIEDENTINFDMIWDFQSPTYLTDKDFVLDEYNCDRSKEICKINLDFSDNFGGELNESDFECKLNFGFGTGNLTGEEEKCNPSTIVVPTGKYDFTFLIQNKDDNNIFFTGSFRVINEGYLEEEESSGIFEESSIEKIYIKTPEIIIQSGLDENYNCKKEDCKINLNYEEDNSKIVCEWDFGSGEFSNSDTENKCNPSYVSYGLGDFRIKLKVYQKDVPENYKKAYLEFSNHEIEELEENDEEEIENQENGEFKEENSPQLEEKELEKNEIENKYYNLKGENGKFLVKKGTGNILEFDSEKYYDYIQDEFKIYYRKLDKGLKIYGNTLPNTNIKLEFEEKEDLSFLDFFVTKVNANYYYSTVSDENGDYEFLLTDINIGDYKINSDIIDYYGNNIEIEKEKNISIDNEYLEEMQSYIYLEYLENKDIYSDETEITAQKDSPLEESEQDKENIKLIPNIEVQGKIGSNKKLAGNVLFCYETCSVNFDGSNSEGDIVNYIWNFGNGEIYEGKNPGYFKYEDYGKYSVNLMLIGEDGKMEIGYFYVIFEEEVQDLKTQESNTGSLEIVSVSNASNDEEIVIEENIEENNLFIYYIFVLILIIVGILVLLKKEKLI